MDKCMRLKYTILSTSHGMLADSNFSLIRTFVFRSSSNFKSSVFFGKYICKQIACERFIDKSTVCCLLWIWFQMINCYLSGPFNPRTLEDFWGIIWQNDSSRIVMLTNLLEGDRVSRRICEITYPSKQIIIYVYNMYFFSLLQKEDNLRTSEF